MPIKIDFRSPFNDYELTIDKCNEIIKTLQDAYDSIREEMYHYFLSTNHLKKMIILSSLMLFLFFATQSNFFLYCVPLTAILCMISAVMSAEYLTSQTRKQILQQIQIYRDKKEKLMKKEQFKTI